MSEHIVHTAVLEDSFRIGAELSAMPESFREVMREYERFAQLGCITVSGDQFSFRLLEEFKKVWPERGDLLRAKLAFVLGWVSHRACDRQMKPIWSVNVNEFSGMKGSDANPAVSPTECSVYHEGFMYHLYYAEDPRFRLALFPDEARKLPGAGLVNLERMAAFVQRSFGSNYLAIQTLNENLPAQPFFEELCIRAQKFYVDPSRYTAAAGSPKPELVAQYLTDINWYSEDDAIVKLAADLRADKTPARQRYDEVYEAEAASYYGQALKLSLSYLTTAAEYFERDDMTMDELKDRLDIGKKGPGGLSV